MGNVDRRSFLQGTSATAAVATTGLITNHARASANDTIRAAVLGVNGRGQTHIEAFQKIQNVEVAVLCDPDRNIAERRAQQFEKKYGRKVEVITDLREVYNRKDIDVVGIATPNHWHALAAIWACQAEKDVYVEKPGSHNVFEGRQLVNAAKRYRRIVQHGVQLRSSPAVREAVAKLREGVIGDVYLARGVVYRWRPSIGKTSKEKIPKGFDWNMWQGPAAEREFSRRYVHYNWHWHWDYGNGDIGNQGVHETDMCMWGLDVGLPQSISAMGGKFLFDDDKETPEVLSACFTYPDQKKMIEFEVRPWSTNDEQGTMVGNIFYGSKGYMVIKGYDTYETYLGQKREKGPRGSKGGNELQLHFANFIDAVRARKPELQHGPVESAHLSSALAHLANISYRLGRRLNFDPRTEQFLSDREADAMLSRAYRKPFEVVNIA